MMEGMVVWVDECECTVVESTREWESDRAAFVRASRVVDRVWWCKT